MIFDALAPPSPGQQQPWYWFHKINRLLSSMREDFNYLHAIPVLINDIKWQYIDGLMQERRNSIANALELRLSCTYPSIYIFTFPKIKPACQGLTHWGRATHICVSKLTIIASDNGLSPGRHQAIIWNNDGILSIGPLGTNFSEILIEILKFSFKKMHLKVASAKRRPFCLGLNVLRHLPVSLLHYPCYDLEVTMPW